MTLAGSPRVLAADLEHDDELWDAFVAGSAQPSYLQTTAWALVKRPNRWSSARVVADGPAGPVGAQLLVTRPPGSPWGMAYVPRGPVAGIDLDGPTLDVFSRRIRAAAEASRLAYVRSEPEVPLDPGLADVLRGLGWVPAPHVQPERTRLIDLARDESAILADMHRKCRQSISKAERLGVRVVDAAGDRLGTFYLIHTDAMRRAGIAPRTERTYRDMWDVLAPRGMARLLFAEATDTGEPLATLFLVSCGPRVVDLYGGTTEEGDRRRANYLLKWEAIRRCREQGFTGYDLWGLPRAGIEQFKSGFGGVEVDYIGAWDLVVSRPGRTLLRTGEEARARYRRWRYRDVHRPAGPGTGETDTAAG